MSVKMKAMCGNNGGYKRCPQPLVRLALDVHFASVLLSLFLAGQGATATREGVTEGFHTFRVPEERQWQHHRYFQNQWKHLSKKIDEFGWISSSKGFRKDGLRLMLAHRDARDSPFRVSKLNATVVEENDFATLFQQSLQRDRARVRAIESMIAVGASQPTTKNSAASGRVHALGLPMKSPVVSGLDFGSGEYFTTLSIGSPATEVLVTVDTGSDLTWVQCYPCDSCYDQIGPIFNPEISESYETVPCFSSLCDNVPQSDCRGEDCEYTQNYGDGSFSMGDLATETITMNSTQGQPVSIHGFLFGCGHDNEGLFGVSAGLLGLGHGRISFPSQIFRVLAPRFSRFSYCLADRWTAIRSSNSSDHNYEEEDDVSSPSTVSYLQFGEPSSATMKYTALLQNPLAPTYYYVQLAGISVANELVKIPRSALDLNRLSGRGGVILDTGTAVTRLSTKAFEAMRDAFRLKAQHLKRVVIPNQELFDTCFQLSDGQGVPLVTLHFAGNVDMLLPLDNIIIPVDSSGTVYCLAFARSDGQGDLTIIGNIQQQGFQIEFDLGTGMVGFTQESCTFF